jgi:C-terminal processing protease CtpA/Prc
MLKQICSLLIVAGCLSQALAAEPVKFTDKQIEAAEWTLRIMGRYRYAGPDRQGEPASALDRYVYLLDREKVFLTGADCAALAREYPVLNRVKKGEDMRAATAVFERVRQRQEENIAYARQLLRVPIAFDSLEGVAVNRLAAARPVTDEEMRELWRLLVKNDRLELHLQGQDADTIAATLDQRYANYLTVLRHQTADGAFEQFMNAYLYTLDPHNNYFAPQSNPPAFLNVSKGLPLMFTRAVNPATANHNAPRPVSASIVTQAGTKLAVIRVLNFNEDYEARRTGDKNYRSAARDVANALDEMKKAGVAAVLLDLRDNGGGSLTTSHEMAGLFLGKRPVMQDKNAEGKVTVHWPKEFDQSWDGPVAILINGRSAGSAEIFAAALQDYRRAVVIGDTSFGFGTVGTMISLDRFRPEGGGMGALKLTVAQYYRVTGASLQLKGVTPDLQFATGLRPERESDYATALPWGEIAPAKFEPGSSVGAMLPELRKRHSERTAKAAAFKALQSSIQLQTEQAAGVPLSLNAEERRAMLRVQRDLDSAAGADAAQAEAVNILLDEVSLSRQAQQ